MSRSWASVAIQYHLTEHGPRHWEDYHIPSYLTSIQRERPARRLTYGTMNGESALGL